MGRASYLEKDPTTETWHKLYVMARQQALLGVLNVGVHRLPAHQLPPEHILSEWDALTSRIGERYERHERQTEELEGILRRLGLRGCILKGTGLARLYPEPCRRHCGDIDLWVQAPRRALLDAFSAEYHVHDVIYQECKVDIFGNTEVELHFHPTKLYNPFCNARLQRWLERHSPIPKTDPSVGIKPPQDDKGCQRSEGIPPAIFYPSPEFNAVFCMAHMYRHYLSGGLGLRQMMDYYYVLKELPAERRGAAMQTLKRLGMGRFTAASMLALRYNFGLEDEYLLCKPDMKRGPRLIEDMIHMGNFGVLDPRNRAAAGETKLRRFFRRNRRTFSNLRLYPREVLWSPSPASSSTSGVSSTDTFSPSRHAQK